MADNTPRVRPESLPFDPDARRAGQTPTGVNTAETGAVDERRRTYRMATRYQGRIEIAGYAFPVMTWDLSMGGARCSVQGVFPPNTACVLYLADDKGKETPLPCKVVRSTGFDTRVSFSALKQGQKDALMALINKFTA